MSEAVVLVKTSRGDIQVVKTQENLVLERVAIAAQGIVYIAIKIPFLIEAANLSFSCTTLPKRMKVTSCVAHPQAWFAYGSDEHIPSTVNAVQLLKGSLSKEKAMHKHYTTKHRDERLKDKNWAETIQFWVKYSDVELDFLTMIKKYACTWNGHLYLINVSKHGVALSSTNAPPIHPALHHARPKKQKFERDKIEERREEGVAESAVTALVLPLIIVPEKDGSLQFCIDY